jgi:uncharacterized membrane protein YhhN
MLAAYAAVAALDAALASRKKRGPRLVTKPALMPLLVAHARRSDPLVRGGLALSWVGDVALLGTSERAFAAGLGSFLAAHVCYLAALAKRRQGGIRRHRSVAALYAAAWVALNAVLWPRTGKMRAPVVVYGTALAAMALAALETDDLATAAGGGAFLVSDSILALRTFGGPQVPGGDALVMLTYTAAQALIAEGTSAPTSP